jgi:hypothetical protein
MGQYQRGSSDINTEISSSLLCSNPRINTKKKFITGGTLVRRTQGEGPAANSIHNKHLQYDLLTNPILLLL